MCERPRIPAYLPIIAAARNLSFLMRASIISGGESTGRKSTMWSLRISKPPCCGLIVIILKFVIVHEINFTNIFSKIQIFIYICFMPAKRIIMHIDLDSFFVSVERKFDPSLIGKPVIIGGSAERGVVASCSYEARKYGIHSAMPTRQALKLCPHAILIRGTHGRYSEASRQVTQIIHNSVPLYQKTSVDEFYIDLTGMDKYHDCYKLATDLRQ